MTRTPFLLAALLLTLTACSSPSSPESIDESIVYTTVDADGYPTSFRITPSISGSPTELGHYLITSAPRNGSMVVATLDTVSDTWRLHLASTSGAITRSFTTPLETQPFAALSPDGATVFYGVKAGGTTGRWSYYVMRSDGGGASLLTNQGVKEGSVAFTPDGSKLAYYISKDDGPDAVMLANRDGSNSRILADTVESIDDYVGALAFSSAGTRIYFMRQKPGHDQFKLWSARIDGSDQRLLTEALATATMAAESPDGSTLAFVGQLVEDSDGADLYLMNTDGSNMRAVTTIEVQEKVAAFPDWSADGSEILAVFMDQKSRTKDRGTLHTVARSSGAPTQVGLASDVVRAYYTE
jgi:Tol biopolymer transport system component